MPATYTDSGMPRPPLDPEKRERRRAEIAEVKDILRAAQEQYSMLREQEYGPENTARGPLAAFNTGFVTGPGEMLGLPADALAAMGNVGAETKTTNEQIPLGTYAFRDMLGSGLEKLGMNQDFDVNYQPQGFLENIAHAVGGGLSTGGMTMAGQTSRGAATLGRQLGRRFSGEQEIAGADAIAKQMFGRMRQPVKGLGQINDNNLYAMYGVEGIANIQAATAAQAVDEFISDDLPGADRWKPVLTTLVGIGAGMKAPLAAKVVRKGVDLTRPTAKPVAEEQLASGLQANLRAAIKKANPLYSPEKVDLEILKLANELDKVPSKFTPPQTAAEKTGNPDILALQEAVRHGGMAGRFNLAYLRHQERAAAVTRNILEKLSGKAKEKHFGPGSGQNPGPGQFRQFARQEQERVAKLGERTNKTKTVFEKATAKQFAQETVQKQIRETEEQLREAVEQQIPLLGPRGLNPELKTIRAKEARLEARLKELRNQELKPWQVKQLEGQLAKAQDRYTTAKLQQEAEQIEDLAILHSYLGKEPIIAAEHLLKGAQEPQRLARALVAMASRDESGRALRSLRQTVYEATMRGIYTSKIDPDSRQPMIDGSWLTDRLKHGDYANAYKEILGPKGFEILENASQGMEAWRFPAAERAELPAPQSNVLVTGARVVGARLASTLAQATNIVGKGGAEAGIGLQAAAIGSSKMKAWAEGITNPAFYDLLNDAILNPKKFAALLRKPEFLTKKDWQLLNSYLVPTVVSQEYDTMLSNREADDIANLLYQEWRGGEPDKPSAPRRY